jgi:hypothetical protein
VPARTLLHIILFSNVFYGACAVALAIENNLQLSLPLNHPFFYLLLFLGTTAFYTFSYFYDPSPAPANERARWIGRHFGALQYAQWVMVILALLAAIIYFIRLFPQIQVLQWWHLLAMAVVPLVAFLYYGISFPGIFHLHLRGIGWMKPLVIGLVWAGAVSLVPVILVAWENGGGPWPGLLPFLWFFVKNWFIITVLCILFDIKDYAADHNRDLKTFVVRVGLRRTIYQIIWPLVLGGFAAFLLFVSHQDFSTGRKMMNLLPFLGLMAVTYSMKQRRPIIYYLLVIDGLMLFKALCGIAGAAFFG